MSQARRASRNSAKFRALSTRITELKVELGWSAVQRRESASSSMLAEKPLPGMIPKPRYSGNAPSSVMMGPWRVSRTITTVGSSWCRTLISSLRRVMATHVPLTSYCAGFSGLILST